ncbi:ATP-binding protein [Oscillatoria sp. HE19RPO]|uniref:ATP-binding protein n=1 Tax=Oscillatoria sp. HE19RPO TaxID=2954806 RepID=UPI0020C4C762|nr:ATP-binding protein [Oscillatoria sp. HE19RPO]
MEQQQPEDVAAYNERSLNTLSRAIALSAEQFAIILVRCNYRHLQTEMLQRLRERCPVSVPEIHLPPLSTTLFGKMIEEFGELPSLPGVMVLGLESAVAIDELLISIDLVRDEFRKQFPFPLILWVTDDLLHRITQFAPNFKSWAGPSIKFEIPTPKLIQRLRQTAENLFNCILEAGADQLQVGAAIELLTHTHRQEIACAIKDIERTGESLDPYLQACLDFVRGWNAYSHDELTSAREFYQRSLAFWQKAVPTLSDSENPPQENSTRNLERYGCLLFYLGACWHREALLHRGAALAAYRQARDYFQQCVAIYQQAHRPDLMAKFINALGEVLQKLRDHDGLEEVASVATQLHQEYPDPIAEAQDCGYWGEVALWNSQWEIAKQSALNALQILESYRTTALTPEKRSFLEWSAQYHRGWYLLLLGRALSALSESTAAIATIEEAKSQAQPEGNPQLYSEILRELRSLYFNRGDRLTAFALKQELYALEHQYGFRAFIGSQPLQPQLHPLNPTQLLHLGIGDRPFPRKQYAGESLTGRESEVECAITRIGRPDYKLTLIHGPAGVGKSSLLSAQLAPALHQKQIGLHLALPLVISIQGDWFPGAVEVFNRAFVQMGLPIVDITEEQNRIPILHNLCDRLGENGDRNILTALLFDVDADLFDSAYESHRHLFYEFLHDCLNVPFVKAVVCLRTEHLADLLENESLRSLEFINRETRGNLCYHLQDLSLDTAHRAIMGLTEQAEYPLESELSEQLVRDLAPGTIAEVRGLMLQLAGTQLEAEQITTLSAYQDYGGKAALLRRGIREAISDCGVENIQIARSALQTLAKPTPDCEQSPTLPYPCRKTLEELTTEIGGSPERLQIVLEILVQSGLLFRLYDNTPVPCYQLVDREICRMVWQG